VSINRRRFLKYAGVGAAIVGASVIGLNFVRTPETATLQSTSSKTMTASSLASSTATTSSVSSALVELSFFFDFDLNGKPAETADLDLTITIGDEVVRGSKVTVPSNSLVHLKVEGTSPTGKRLTTATYAEPRRPMALPALYYQTGSGNASVGLADGPATSPIRPSDMNLQDYEYYRRHPYEWLKRVHPIYPAGNPYEPNYFFYGYLKPGTYGVPEGKPHLAFDIWAADGKPVHACWGGKIVRGLYDWRFGIDSGSHIAYYNHLVPTVHVGDFVSRYDVVGHIEKGQGHVHFELRPDPTEILSIFTTMSAKDALKSPLRGEKVPQLPYFS